MNVILDTNIIIDAIAARKPFDKEALEILRKFGRKEINCAITASTASDIYYISNKYLKNEEKTISILKKMFAMLNIIAVTKADCLKAFETGVKDYEDSLLFVCASKWNADFIITRNVSDFAKSDIQAITPVDFLNIE